MTRSAMRFTVIGVTALLGSLTSLAVYAEGPWTKISDTSTATTEIKNGSYLRESNSAGDPAASMVVRFTNKRAHNQVTLYKESVTAADCRHKRGKIKIYGMTGKYVGENDFVFDGDTTASAVAEIICRLDLKNPPDAPINTMM